MQKKKKTIFNESWKMGKMEQESCAKIKTYIQPAKERKK